MRESHVKLLTLQAWLGYTDCYEHIIMIVITGNLGQSVKRAGTLRGRILPFVKENIEMV